MSGWQAITSALSIPFTVWMIAAILKDARFQEECRRINHHRAHGEEDGDLD